VVCHTNVFCVLIAACSQGNTAAPVAPAAAAAPTVTGIAFSNTAAPTDQYAAGTVNAALNMSKTYTTSVVTVSFSDGTQKQYPLEHKMLFRSDDVVPTGPNAGEYYGGIIDKNGAPVLDATAANNPFYVTVTNKAVAAGLKPANKNQFVADTPDGAALIQIPGAPSSVATADLSYLSHFEYVTWDGNRVSQYGKNPMFIGNSTVSQDLTTGLLTMKRFNKLAFSGLGQKGLWIPCAGSKSPWNTFLGSEEYEADQWNFDMNKLKGTPLDFSNGNLVQAFQNKFGDATARPYDYGYVTETTVIQTSPKSTLANKAPGEVGAVAGAELGAGTLEWIRLGHATDAGIKALIDAGTKSTDIFDIALETAAGVLPVAVPGVVGTGIAGAVTAADMVNAGYKRVFNYYHRHTKGKAEWLRLRPGMNQAAAFLETRRYAVYLGATSEWTKMEGVAMNAANKKVYIAISYQYDSMTDGVGDIQMGLLTAGNTYELSLAANVGNPDNLKFSAAYRTLFIGEDSNCHVNNFVWAVTTQHPLDFVLWQGARSAESVAYGLYVRIRASQQRR